MRRSRFRLPLHNMQGGLGSIPGLVAIYDAERVSAANNTTLSTLTDFSGNGWHGTAPSSTYEATFLHNVVNGKKAFRFVGSDYYITDLYGPGTDFTILVTINPTNPRSLVRFQHAGTPYVVYPYGSVPSSAIESTSGGGISAGISADVWQVGIYRSRPSISTNGRQTFVNGSLVAQATTAAYNHANRLYIGAYLSGPSEYTNSYVTTIAIWNRFLTDLEIAYATEIEKARVGIQL